MFDTFTGAAVSGPLHEAGVVLEQFTVTVSRGASGSAAHPDTRIVAEDGGHRPQLRADPLRGAGRRRADLPDRRRRPPPTGPGPVVGVITPDGTAVAFPVDPARAALAAGRDVAAGGVEAAADVRRSARARRPGRRAAAHEAFWFAWSQFHPTTLVWTPIGS